MTPTAAANEIRQHALTASSFAVAVAALAAGIALGEWVLGATLAIGVVAVPLMFEERLSKRSRQLIPGAMMIAFGVASLADHLAWWNAAIFIGSGGTCLVAWEVDRRRQARRVSGGDG